MNVHCHLVKVWYFVIINCITFSRLCMGGIQAKFVNFFTIKCKLRNMCMPYKTFNTENFSGQN